MIHVAGNSVVDLLLRDVPLHTEALDGWGRGNVHFLEQPPEPVLGGNGGAVAYLLGRLGEQVSLNTQVGQDTFGQTLRGWLEEAGVALTCPPAEHTAVNTVLLSPEGTRRSVYYTGEKVNWRRSLGVREAAWFYASGYGGVTSEDLRELTGVFEGFRARGTKVAFDPGPWFFAAAKQEEMLDAWRGVDCLIGTAGELGTWYPDDGVESLVGRILQLGPGRVVVKRGGEGAAFGGRDEGIGFSGTERLRGGNTMGAGDTFNAGLLHGLRRGRPLEASVGMGLKLATEAVRQGRGALGAIGAGLLRGA